MKSSFLMDLLPISRSTDTASTNRIYRTRFLRKLCQLRCLRSVFVGLLLIIITVPLRTRCSTDWNAEAADTDLGVHTNSTRLVIESRHFPGSVTPLQPPGWWHRWLRRIRRQQQSSSKNTSLNFSRSSPNLKLNTSNHTDVLQSTAEYWVECIRGWSERLGLTTLKEEILNDPVVTLIRSAGPSEEERQQLQHQREYYYRDDSRRSVLLTLGISSICCLLSLLAFELLLQDRPVGLGRALAVPRLCFSPVKVAELSHAGSSCSVPSAGSGSSLSDENGDDAGPSTGRTLARTLAKHINNARGQVRCRTLELVRKVLVLEESKVLEFAGMDALMMLRFCALCGRFCAICGVWCLLLVPLYANGGSSEALSQGLSLYSLSNLEQGSLRFWAVVPAAYLVNLALCGLLWKEYEHFVKLRRNFLGGGGGESAITVPPDSKATSRTPDDTVLDEQRDATKGILRSRSSPLVRFNLDVELPWQRGVTPPRLLHLPPSVSWQGRLYPSIVPSTQQANVDDNSVLDLAREQARRSVLLEKIPPELCDPAALRYFLEDLLGVGSVVSIAFAPPDARRLSELLQAHSQLVRSQGNPSSPSASSKASCSGPLAALEERIWLRREEFGLAMASQKQGLQARSLKSGLGSFLSVNSEPPGCISCGDLSLGSDSRWPRMCCGNPSHAWRSCVTGIDENSLEDYSPSQRLGISPSQRSVWSASAVAASNWVECQTAALLAIRTAAFAVAGAVASIGAVAAEIAGTSVQRVSDLVPASALASAIDTPRLLGGSAAEPPFGGLFPGRGYSFPVSPSTAFVTFHSLQAACIACQVALDEDAVVGTELIAVPAPEPRDVIWENIARPQAQLLVRTFFVEVALILGLAFWSVPVSLLQVWCSLSRLSYIIKWLQDPAEVLGRDMEALLTLYLPVLSLLVLLEFLPEVLQKLASRYEGVKSWSALQMLTMRRYWRFQLATIGVTVLSGSVSQSLKMIVDQPATVLWELGQSLPQVSVYFLATVISSALVVGPVSLLRIPLLARFGWSAAKRQLERLCRMPAEAVNRQQFVAASAEDFLDSPPLAADLSALLLVLLVCVTYATIAPLILIVGAMFFVMRWLVLALRYFYVHVPRFDSGGEFWYILWHQALLALILGDLTTLAAVGLRSGYAQLPFLLPLPLLPVAFRMRAEYRFAEPSRRLSLRAARALDARADPNLADRFPHDAYWHPALRIISEGLEVSPEEPCVVVTPIKGQRTL